MKICTVCWSNNCSHSDRYKVEIDNNIADIICTLNKKGYYTSYCCGGHINRDEIKDGFVPNIYIAFNGYNDKLSNINIEKLNDSWIWSSSKAILRCMLKEAKQFKGHELSDDDAEYLKNLLKSQINILKEFVNDLK